MKSLIKLNPEQLQYLKSLDSKKKKHKFLLDCFVEEIEYEKTKSFTEFIDEFLSGKKICKMNGFGYFDPKGDLTINTENPFPEAKKLFEKVEKEVKRNEMLSEIALKWLNVDSKEVDSELKEIVSKQVDKLFKDGKAIPSIFGVEITPENRSILEGIYCKQYNYEKIDFLGKYFCSKPNAFFSHDNTENEYSIVTTEEFLKYIGREDLIEKDKLLKFDNLEEPLPYCVKVVESNARILTDLYNSIKSMKVKEIPSGMWLICDSGNLEVINSPYKIVYTSEFLKYYNTVKDLL